MSAMRNALMVAATALVVLATGCSTDTTSTETPAAESASVASPESTQPPLAGGFKGAARNGDGIVYHRSDCGYGYVRFYGFGGDGPGSACGTWALAPYQRDIIHSFDWNFRTEDLTQVHLGSFVIYEREVDYSNRYPYPPRAYLARSWEQTFFEQVNRINGGKGNAFTDLINNNLPGHDIKDGKATPGRSR